MTGTVKTVYADKGFGFIAAEDGKQYFFHKSAIQNGSIDDMGQGMPVTFVPSMGDKGPRAENVEL